MDDSQSSQPNTSSNAPDSNAPGTNANSQISPLEAGLSALKHKDYETAIAHLELVCQTAIDQSTLLKAQMGLVKAYELTGNVNWAIASCEPLQKSSSRQVRSWAVQTLEELHRRYSQTSDNSPSASQSNPNDDQDRFTKSSESEDDQNLDNPFVLPPGAITGDRSSAEIQSAEPAVSETIQTSPSSPLRQPPAQAAQSANQEPIESSLPNPYPLQWRQAGRAQKWGPLCSMDLAKLWAVEAGTMIALFWVIRAVFLGAMAAANQILSRITVPIDLRPYVLYKEPGWLVAMLLITLFCLTPWLLDGVLQGLYGAKPLPMNQLERYSPEAVRVLRRVCGQQHLPVPSLMLLPANAPLILTYGFLPRNARIAVSQGMLELRDDEIAVLYASEIAHIVRWDFAILSLVTLAAQIPYLIYWQAAVWGGRHPSRILQAVAAGISALSYGVYWLFRLPGLWLSRLRVYYSDRSAAEATGNPNGLTRALLKVAIGTAQEIQQHGQTDFLLESFELLTPVGYRTALTLGSACFYAPVEPLLEWDQKNPYRHWLAINNAHPPLGDRLKVLTMYTRHWRLDSELDLAASSTSRSPLQHNSHRFLLQSAPFLGMGMGVAIAVGLWLLGALAARLNWYSLSWMSGDPSILKGLLLLGFSVGTFLRINAFFPDIKPAKLQDEPFLPDLLANLTALPIDSQSVRLQGKLLGRRTIGNQLAQDLVLQSSSGLIKLHYSSKWGPLGHLLPTSISLQNWVGSSVTVVGWFRRGATPWIDIDTVQLRSKIIRSGHPIWSTVLACLTALSGAYVIVRGGT